MKDSVEKAGRFGYTISGVATHGGKVLLCRQENEDFWILPGCKVRFFESSIDTLKKLIKEDFGTDIHVERLIWVAENFYEKNGKDYHELAFYYLIDFPAGAELYDLQGPENRELKGGQLVFQWYPIEELEKLALFPEFLKTKLKAIPAGIEHISCGHTK